MTRAKAKPKVGDPCDCSRESVKIQNNEPICARCLRIQGMFNSKQGWTTACLTVKSKTRRREWVRYDMQHPLHLKGFLG